MCLVFVCYILLLICVRASVRVGGGGGGGLFDDVVWVGVCVCARARVCFFVCFFCFIVMSVMRCRLGP